MLECTNEHDLFLNLVFCVMTSMECSKDLFGLRHVTFGTSQGSPAWFLRRGFSVRFAGREECLCCLEFDMIVIDIDTLPRGSVALDSTIGIGLR